MLFSAGPLAGIYLHRARGGNGIIGGLVAGVATACLFVAVTYVDRAWLHRGASLWINYAGLLVVVTLLEGCAGLLLGVFCWLGDRAIGAKFFRRRCNA
jgi:hypothetical protein